MSDALRVLAVLALIAGNAFFVIGEYSVVTARRGAVANLADAGTRGARVALRLMDDPVRVISTAQVGITAIGILTGAVGRARRARPARRRRAEMADLRDRVRVRHLPVKVLFGELVPKALTLDRAERLAALVAPPIEVIARILKPVVWVLGLSASVVLRPFGVREVVAGQGIRSVSELQALVDEAEVSGVIPRAQEELLHNVFDFAGREAADVMVPEPDVVWLEAALTAGRGPGTRSPPSRSAATRSAWVARSFWSASSTSATSSRRRARRRAADRRARSARFRHTGDERISARCCGSCASSAAISRWSRTSTAAPPGS